MQQGNGDRIWENADPDIPILKQAKAEYANCNSRLLAKLRIANVVTQMIKGNRPW